MEVLQRLRGVGPDLLREHHERLRLQSGRQRLAVERRIGVREDEHAPAVGSELVGALARRERCVGQHHLRCAHHPRTVALEGRGAPLASGRERHRGGTRPTVGRRERRGERVERPVAILVGRERAEGGRDVGVVERLDLVEHDLALGERAGLVQADHVDARQSFDGRKLLHQDLAPSERDRGDPERDAGEQHESLGHHSHHAGDRAAQSGIEVGVAQLAPEQQRGSGDEGPDDDAQDQVDAVHQLRARELEPASFGGDLARVRVGADARGLEPAAAGDDEAPGQDLVARVLVDRVALARQQRLVDFEPDGESHNTVTRDLVAGAQIEQVVDHNVLDRDFVTLPSRTTRARGAFNTAS